MSASMAVCACCDGGLCESIHIMGIEAARKLLPSRSL